MWSRPAHGTARLLLLGDRQVQREELGEQVLVGVEAVRVEDGRAGLSRSVAWLAETWLPIRQRPPRFPCGGRWCIRLLLAGLPG
jgi:hypothetical protein